MVRAVPPYIPGEQPGDGQRVVKLNTNENPYPPSPRVLDALRAALDGSVRLYPDPEAAALRRRVSALYDVPVDHVLAGNGSDELIALLLRATVDPGDRVAVPSPTYSLYDTMVAVQGGRVVRVPFPPDFSLPPALADVATMHANVARIRTTRATLTAGLECLGYTVLPSQANFVLARRAGEDQATVVRALAAKHILVRHFPTPDLHDALRITVGTDEEITTLLAALAPPIK